MSGPPTTRARARARAGAVRRIASRALPVLVALVDGMVVNGLTAGHGTWLALVAAAALLLRRRAPEVAVLAGLPGLYLGHIAFAPLIALYCVAVRRDRLLVAATGAAAVAVAWFLPHPAAGVSSLVLDRETALLALDCCGLAAGIVVLGRSVRSRQERLREATARRAWENQVLTERVLATERNRLAREMHDVVAHKVSLISLQAGALQVSRPGDTDVRTTARSIHELSAQTLTELRHLVGVLRTAGGTDAGAAPRAGLADIPDLVRDSGLPVDLDLPACPAPVPEAVERAAYRTVQEALTNIRKHAPGARARVRVHFAAGLHIEVHNTPPPARDTSRPALPGGGHGLVGLRERAHLLSGEFHAGPGTDGGFTVRAVFPVGWAPSDGPESHGPLTGTARAEPVP
ncbi:MULTISPECIES: sensor histidine kinase [Streptomyces]|nr:MULTISPECIES: histidine kinase [Streptomyces]UUA06238.1 histidine kinase [Streptomyces koelreuteriae]UUA13865.1 histidine kinase [Streptomyces sp. CRCS-T-1]